MAIFNIYTRKYLANCNTDGVISINKKSNMVDLL